jgi:hypothetical protein
MAITRIVGTVKTPQDQPVPGVALHLHISDGGSGFWEEDLCTNGSGYYATTNPNLQYNYYLLVPTSPYGGTFTPTQYGGDGSRLTQQIDYTKNFVLTGATIPDLPGLRFADTDWLLEAAREVQAYYEIGYASGSTITYMRRYVDATITEHVQEGLFKQVADLIRATYQSGAVVGDIKRAPAGTYYESKVERQAGYMYRVRRQTVVVGSWYYTGQAFGTQFPNPYEGAGNRTFGIDRIV